MYRTALLLPLCAALLLPGCLDGGDDTPDSGTQPDSQVQPDATSQVDSGPTPDAAVNCTVQDLFDQFQCGAGRKCTLTDGLSTVGCADSGFTAAYTGCDPTYPDTCEIGTLCSNQAGAHRCLPFCSQPGSACQRGRCGNVPMATDGSTTAYLCEPEDNCDPVTSDPGASGCSTNQACYVISVGAGLTFCESEGVAQPEETCTGDYDCVQGYACFGGGPMYCKKVCRKDTDADCPGSQTCGPLNADYGLCF